MPLHWSEVSCLNGRVYELSHISLCSYSMRPRLLCHYLTCTVALVAQVARIAKMMVTQMGMSDKLGQVAWANSGGPSFLGAQMGQSSDCSMATTDLIDAEVKDIVERAYR